MEFWNLAELGLECQVFDMDKTLTKKFPSDGVGIAVVERATGLSKDTLRVWERRYGFPIPDRNASGERLYAPEQVARLGVIKRLMDQGHRPGRLMNLSIEDLTDLGATVAPTTGHSDDSGLLDLLRAHDAERLNDYLQSAMLRDGLSDFVIRRMPAFNRQVGDAWTRGELAIFEEHLYSQHVQRVVTGALQQLRPASSGERVLLTTVPGESHGLGLLMLQALLALRGFQCVSLGTETPVPEIGHAARAHGAIIVALSFSEAFPLSGLRAVLDEVVVAVPATADIWIGGSGAARLSRLSARVRRFTTLEGAMEMADSRYERSG